MADSLLNHSWPSFSRRWMKRWSFKRGSECKPAVRGLTSSTSAVPAAGCSSSPEPRSPSLMVEDEVFFGSMAEEREDNSSPEADPSLAHIHSSVEDLLSLDSALQGSEYYKDLGLAGPTEPAIAATAVTLPPEPALPVTSDLWLPAVSSPPPALEKACHYLDEDCACSCGSGRQHGLVRGAPEWQEGEEPLLAPVGSPPASQRHNWGSLLPPAEDQHRLRLDTLGTEREDKARSPPLPLPWAGLATWADNSVIQVDVEPVCLDLGFRLEPGDGDFGSGGKHLRVTSAPSPCGTAPSRQGCQRPEASLLVTLGVVPPGASENTEKEHLASQHLLMVQQVLAELREHHRNEEAAGKSEKGERTTRVKRRLSNLRSRVAGSWQKEKGKNKDWEEEEEEEEAKEPRQAMHGHDWHRGGGGVEPSARGTSFSSLWSNIPAGPKWLPCLNESLAPTLLLLARPASRWKLPAPLSAFSERGHVSPPAPNSCTGGRNPAGKTSSHVRCRQSRTVQTQTTRHIFFH